MTRALRGGSAIVTGAAQGLGRAVALAYAREGMNLALLDIRGDLLDELAEACRGHGVDALAFERRLVRRGRNTASRSTRRWIALARHAS